MEVFMYITQLTWEDFEKISFNKSVLLIPIAPIEEHGPHLPIGVDCFFAEEACRRSAEKLKSLCDVTPYIYPLIPLGVAYETSDFPGTYSLDEKLFIRLIQHKLESIVHWGFKYCIIVSPHASPSHLGCIHTSIQLVLEKYDVLIDEPMSRWIFQEQESAANYAKTNPNFYPDIHAGDYETSLMLHLYPKLVKKELLERLQPRKIKDLKSPGTWKEKGAIEGYLGDPSQANPQKGKMYIRTLEAWANAVVKLFEEPPQPLPERLEVEVARLKKLVT
jgi:creatinine amidohydrolase